MCLWREVSHVRRQEGLLSITSLSSAAERCAATWGRMSVSATPAGKVRVARKVSRDPEGDSPDKGAERCW